MPTRNKKTNIEEVRPHCMFMLTGGLITGTVMLGLGHFMLGAIVAAGGFIGALLTAGGAKLLDFIEVFEYKSKSNRSDPSRHLKKPRERRKRIGLPDETKRGENV